MMIFHSVSVASLYLTYFFCLKKCRAKMPLRSTSCNTNVCIVAIRLPLRLYISSILQFSVIVQLV